MAAASSIAGAGSPSAVQAALSARSCSVLAAAAPSAATPLPASFLPEERRAAGGNEALLSGFSEELYERQIRRERLALAGAKLKYTRLVDDAVQRDAGGQLPAAKLLLNRWFAPLVDAIKLEKKSLKEAVGGGDRMGFWDYTALLDEERLAVISLHCVLSAFMKGPSFTHPLRESRALEDKVKTARLVQMIGEAVQAQVNLAKLDIHARKQREDDRERAEQRGWRQPAGKSTSRQLRGVSATNIMAARERLEDAMWEPWLRAKVGSLLLRLVLETAYVTLPSKTPGESEHRPAFEHTYVYDRQTQHKHGAIRWHEAIPRIIETHHKLREVLQPSCPPMLVPPRPWTKYNKGGYLLLDSVFMRGGYGPAGPARAQLDAIMQEDARALKAGEAPSYQPVLEALNVLGRTKWSINDSVLRVMEQVWEAGGGIIDIPSATDLPVPSPPTPMFTLHTHGMQMLCSGGKPHKRDLRAHKVALRRWRMQNSELHSLRSDFLLKLRVAQENRSEAAIFFPHNVDFRGRAYTIHPHLNHLGADNCRGLLRFAEARPLGARGLRWLRIQVANLYGGGVDKLPLDQREGYVVAHMADVLDSAHHPLTGRRWWQQAEDPWQCLATCLELAEAEAHSDPATFLSRLPIHQDGSCNGLQHYAALARDEEGGRAVNLLPGEQPADVYKGIADLVRVEVAHEAAGRGNADAVTHARMVEAHVDRKLVKQTVMTSVYGVTFLGARDQILNRLRERKAFENQADTKVAAVYAARKVLEAMGEMFSNARNVMDWLNECARDIAQHDLPVRWRSPVGLPVVQPYRKRGKRSVQTVLQTFTVMVPTEHLPVIKTKQRTAFPPNYIHSLDSAHMMLTALACDTAGLTFAGVHDSFWTHAGTVDEMSSILRGTFIELHSAPLLQQLYDDFRELYPQVVFQDPPLLGTLRLENIRGSVYFFA